MASMLDAALHYALALRIPVFPCNPDDKRPFTVHGFKDASREEAQVRAWWTRFPDAMIGIPTGEISGVWVLDIDVDPVKGVNGFPLWSELIARNGEVPPHSRASRPAAGGICSSCGSRSSPSRAPRAFPATASMSGRTAAT